jgi:hypothetical protein
MAVVAKLSPFGLSLSTVEVPLTPFGLSLSKPTTFLKARKAGEAFDRLRPNGARFV